jgi:hypothetical protein
VLKNITSLSRCRRIKPGQAGGGASAAGRWGISPKEGWLCAVVVIGCVLLHFVPVYNLLGLPIVILLSLISFATPVSGMLFLSAAQVIPDAHGSPLPVAQMALAGFLIWQFAKGRTTDLLNFGRPLLTAVAPFFIWAAGLSLMRGYYMFGILLLFSILTGCAAATLVRQSGNRLEICLLMFLVGQALAMCLFWIVKLHLGTPVQAFATELYGDSTMPGARIGTARGNANMLGPPMALVGTGVIAWFICRPKQNWQAGLIALLCLAAVVPPLIGSGSRGAIMSVVWGALFLMSIRVLAGGRSVGNALVAVAGVAVVLVLGWHSLGLDEHWQEMKDRQTVQQSETGASLAAGRTLEWTAAWNGILDSPIFGGGEVHKLSYFDDPSMWMSHSTYLDAGLNGGFPGMALFVGLVLAPIFKLWRYKLVPVVGWLLAVYVVAIISIGSTSAMQLKYYWMLWGMAGVCFAPVVAGIKSGRGHSIRKPVGRSFNLSRQPITETTGHPLETGRHPSG